MPTLYLINLNYVCNERCVFCAADLASKQRHVLGRHSLTFEEIKAWIDESPPTPQDRVILAGGEPTLHKQLLPVVQIMAERCVDVRIFSNGLRFSDPSFARRCVDAGITRFEIALFGASSERHDAVTQAPGSFERTMEGLCQLVALRKDHKFVIEVRLLISRQSSPENPEIVRMVMHRVPGVDAISLNRLILSGDAASADAMISWEEARGPTNESAKLIRDAGYELLFGGVPLCVFEGENATFVRRRLTMQAVAERQTAAWKSRYLDPLISVQHTGRQHAEPCLALPFPCVRCDYVSYCGRVEEWYVNRYGNDGLRPVRIAL